MDISVLVEKINDYDVTGKTKPESIKIILGVDGYGGSSTIEEYCKNTPIDIYRKFGEVAFIMNDLSYKCSEILVLGLLFDGIDEGINFLKLLQDNKTDKTYEHFIEYLFYEKGIVLINRKNKSKDFKIFKSNGYKVSDVLVIGSEAYKTALKNIGKGFNASKILHCSSYNLGNDPEKYSNAWFLHDDSSLETIETYEGTSFSNFRLNN